jgi:hypothetical protein
MLDFIMPTAWAAWASDKDVALLVVLMRCLAFR